MNTNEFVVWLLCLLLTASWAVFLVIDTLRIRRLRRRREAELREQLLAADAEFHAFSAACASHAAAQMADAPARRDPAAANVYADFLEERGEARAAELLRREFPLNGDDQAP